MNAREAQTLTQSNIQKQVDKEARWKEAAEYEAQEQLKEVYIQIKARAAEGYSSLTLRERLRQGDRVVALLRADGYYAEYKIPSSFLHSPFFQVRWNK